MIYVNSVAKPKLSDLVIDVDKDWAARKIENLGAPDSDDDASRRDTLASLIAAKIKSGVVTDTTDVGGEVSVSFTEAFASTPVVTIQLENDVDYYPVMISKSTTGFTVKILKTAHAHSQGNTGGEATHTHGISFTSGAGSAHHHSNPNTSSKSAGTPSGTISSVSAGTPAGSISSKSAGTPAGTVGGEAAHTHGISLTSGAGSAHKHTQGVTGEPSALLTCNYNSMLHEDVYCAITSGGSTVQAFRGIASEGFEHPGSSTHTHTNPDTATESSHTHSVSGTSEAGSSHSHSFAGNALAAHNHTFSGSALGTHNHAFSGSALGTHYHTQGNTGNESSHTHSVSGTSGAGSGHAHSNPNTNSANAGNALASTGVTFSYIAMLP